MQGELSDLGQQGLFPSIKLLGKIAWMAAQSLGIPGDEVVDEVVFSLLDLSESQRMPASSLRSDGIALKEVDHQ